MKRGNRGKHPVIFLTISAAIFPQIVRAQFLPPSPAATNLPLASVTTIIRDIMYWLLQLVGILAVIGFVIAGILYLTAAGSDDRIATAKSALLYSIIGIIVALGGLVAILFAQSLLSGTLGIFK